MRKTIREIFSGANGKLSAKRVIGGIAMAVALGCTIWLVAKDGSNSVVENLLMTIFITSVSLLGLPAVTSVWGSSKLSVGKTEEEPAPEPVPEPVTVEQPVEIPNCETCEFKKKYDRYNKNKKGTE
jgi:hypothetical protein